MLGLASNRSIVKADAELEPTIDPWTSPEWDTDRWELGPEPIGPDDDTYELNWIDASSLAAPRFIPSEADWSWLDGFEDGFCGHADLIPGRWDDGGPMAEAWLGGFWTGRLERSEQDRLTARAEAMETDWLEARNEALEWAIWDRQP